MKRVIVIFFTFFSVLVIFINTFSFFNISFFGYRIYLVGSGSMEPFIKSNDIIILKRENDYNINDVVTFKENNIYVTHRIILKNNDFFVTKGDANNVEDNPIKKSSIVGKVIFKSSLIGLVLSNLKYPIVLFAIFVFGLLITFLIPDKKI